MNEKQKCCIIIFDEMSLSCQIQYNKKEDYVEGVGKNGSSPEIVDHTNVFMVQGIYSRWKQPEIGLNVIATVCDQGGSNQAAINSLLKDTDEIFKRKGKENKLFGFLVNDQEIVALKEFTFYIERLAVGLACRIAKWDHIKCLYYLDSEEDERICPKLTDRHILKERINKMKVSTCMQVFSYQVGSLMKGIAMWGAPDKTMLDETALDTAELILFLDKLFDSLNANSKTGPTTKLLKGGVTENSPHESFWRMAIETIQTMKFYSVQKQSLVTVPSLKNLIHTLKGFIYLKHVLLNKYNFKFILTRFFNQDPLENFFSYIRSHGVRNVSPGPTHFIR
ncbi:hypothetical protein NQ315_014798, partial [Exocentrus adspersus]